MYKIIVYYPFVDYRSSDNKPMEFYSFNEMFDYMEKMNCKGIKCLKQFEYGIKVIYGTD